MIGLGLGFVVLFVLRLAYGFWSHPADPTSTHAQSSPFELSRKNYATSKHARPEPGGGSATFDQKYERVADASLATGDFDEDEAELRAAVAKHAGLVQAEHRSGLVPGRRLSLVIGVDPDRFDAMVEELRGVATLTRLELRKTDKTNEYQKLQATRRSLEKSMAALVQLPRENQSLNALLELERQMLDREKEIQEVGVQLGDFDEENEFCTVNVQLVETQSATAGPSWPQRLKVAFEWTVPWYLALIALLALGAIGLLCGLMIVDRLGLLRLVLESTSRSRNRGNYADLPGSR